MTREELIRRKDLNHQRLLIEDMGTTLNPFDPASTWVRTDGRVLIGSNNIEKYNRVLNHDDVVIASRIIWKRRRMDSLLPIH